MRGRTAAGLRRACAAVVSAAGLVYVLTALAWDDITGRWR